MSDDYEKSPHDVTRDLPKSGFLRANPPSMSSPPYVKAKFTRRSYKVTDRIPNSQRACHQIFLLYVLPPPSVFTPPGVTDRFLFERIAHGRRPYASQDYRTSFAQHPATTADFTRCDVGQVISIDTLPDDVLLIEFSSLCER